MIIWLAMLIPLIGCAVAYHIWNKQFVWWELILPTVVSFLTILCIKYAAEKSAISDTQYMGGIIVEARYYEYWSTWITKTCSEQYACGSHTEGSGKDAHSVTDYCTRYYDCSYCDENDPYWEALDDQGHVWRISQSEYNTLRDQWWATPEFVHLNRQIDYSGGCGKDGNMYSIRWDGKMLDVESSTWAASYDNKVQASKSNFDLKDISDEEAEKYGLYKYPKVYKYKQANILGLDSIEYLPQPNKLGAIKLFEYFNGTYGPKRKIRVYVLLFFDKSLETAIRQKNYWDGGNKNEVAICIDVNKKTGHINWVYPFTWTENKRIAVDLREDISNLKTLDFTALYHVVDKSTTDFVYRDFSKFDYLEIDPKPWELWVVYLLTLGITIGLLYYGYENQFENE